MILKSLTLKNFRIYKEAEIYFSSGDKNITIIQGNNEVGKTTIMNAFTWCLYEEEFYKKKGKKPIWNSFVASELKNGDEDYVEVIIEMEDEDNNRVEFKRVLNFYKNDLGKVIEGKSKLEINEDDGKNNTQYLNTETYLNKHLPSKLRKYFLFNGEQLANFFDFKKNGNIKDSVEQLSQLNLLNRLVSHVNSIETTHISRGKELAPELTKIRNDIKTEESKCKDKKEEYDKALKDKKTLDRCIEELEAEISKKKDPKLLMDERKEKEKEFIKKISDIEQNNKKYKEYLLDKFCYIVSYNSLNELQNVGKDLVIKNYIPADIKKSFLKQLLENKICICGEPLEEGSEHYQHILDLFNDTSPITDIEEKVNNLLGSTKVHISDYPINFKDILKKIKKEENDLIKAKSELNNRITEIDNILENMGSESIIKKQKKLKSFRKSRDTLIQQIASYKGVIENSRNELKKLREREREEEQKMDKYDKNEQRLKFVRHIKKISDTLRNDISKEMHLKLEEATTDIYTQMHWKEDFYDFVKIDENYSATVYQKDGDINTDGDLSDGGSLTLALAITLALNSLSGFELPIVIDTPMGDLDEPIQMNIAEFLPEYSKKKQVTLLVKSKEYTKEFRDEIIDCVGNEYKLQFSDKQKGITRVVPWS